MVDSHSHQSPKNVNALLLDIEGTTTPVDFVYKTLFPYARLHLASYLAKSFEAEDRAMLLEEYHSDSSAEKPLWNEPPIDYILWLMDHDRKVRALKSIQGRIWENGYRNGALRGVLFPDVAPALRRWKSSDKKIFIYSSGSVKAQRLLFENSIDGDLSQLIDGYFDTEVGSKKETTSYKTILIRINLPANECLFISDVTAECQAAHDAEFNVLLSVRPGNEPQDSLFPKINSLDEIFFYPEQIDIRKPLTTRSNHVKSN